MSENQPFVVSSTAEKIGCLQARFQELGYLLFKRQVAAEACDQLLASLLAQTNGQVALDSHTGLPALKGRPFVESDADWDDTTRASSRWNNSTGSSTAGRCWT